MKKLLFIFVFVFSVLFGFPISAHAEVVLDSDIDTLESVYAFSGLDKNEYKYFVLQQYTTSSGNKYRILLSRKTLSYCTKYGALCFHPSDSIDKGDAYYHVDDTDTYCYDVKNGVVSSTGVTYVLYYKDSPNITEYRMVNNHNIYNFETGELVFRKAPLTHLAEIVEQSSRQTTPIIQVIYLLPLLTSLVVSFLALRKCLHLLRTILYQV